MLGRMWIHWKTIFQALLPARLHNIAGSGFLIVEIRSQHTPWQMRMVQRLQRATEFVPKQSSRRIGAQRWSEM